MVLLPRRWHILLTDKWLNNFQLKMMKLVHVAQNCEFVKVGYPSATDNCIKGNVVMEVEEVL